MKMKTHSTFVLVLVVFIAIMLGSASLAQGDDTNNDAVEALQQVDLTWSKLAATKQIDLFLNYLGDNASMLAPNAPVIEGKEGVAEMMRNLFNMDGFFLEWQPTYVNVSTSNDLGYSYGTYEMKFNGPDGKSIVDNGKYMTVWKKDSDRKWKVAADMFNTNAPLPTAEN